MVAAKDGAPRSLATIEVFDLNRNDLVDERCDVHEKVVSALKDAMGKAMDERKPVGSYLEKWVGPSAPYLQSV